LKPVTRQLRAVLIALLLGLVSPGVTALTTHSAAIQCNLYRVYRLSCHSPAGSILLTYHLIS